MVATPTTPQPTHTSDPGVRATQPPEAVHPHPIHWDRERQLWICSAGCPFARPKREGEVVYGMDQSTFMRPWRRPAP